MDPVPSPHNFHISYKNKQNKSHNSHVAQRAFMTVVRKGVVQLKRVHSPKPKNKQTEKRRLINLVKCVCSVLREVSNLICIVKNVFLTNSVWLETTALLRWFHGKFRMVLHWWFIAIWRNPDQLGEPLGLVFSKTGLANSLAASARTPLGGATQQQVG